MQRAKSNLLRVLLMTIAFGIAGRNARAVLADDGPHEVTSISIGTIGDWVLLNDGVTLVVSRPATGQLTLFDTVEQRKLRDIDVNFAPDQLALQGDSLFVSRRGSNFVHQLEAQTGTERARFKVPGEPIQDLCCHSTRGPLFAANLNEEILTIDTTTEVVQPTTARGTILAIDPVDGEFLLAGTNRAAEDFIEVQRDEGVDRVRLVTIVGHAAVLKYAVEDTGLRLTAANVNAAFGDGSSLAVSRDGSQFAMAAGGGWHSLTDKRYHYVVAVFETNDMETMSGQVDVGAYPRAVAFHPLIDVGAVVQDGTTRTIKVFKTTSFVDRQLVTPDGNASPSNAAHRLLFCGRGATVAYQHQATLTFIGLELSDEERAALEKHFQSQTTLQPRQ